MNILVTGGAGAIGAFAVAELLKQGHSVWTYDVRQEPPGEWIAGDIRDLGSLTSALLDRRIQRVIHAAALIDSERTRPMHTVDINIGGTLNVLEACRVVGVQRVVVCSNRGVYGRTTGTPHGHPTYRPLPEDYPQMLPEGKNTLYNASKQFCEHLVVQYQRRYGLSAVVVRFGATFGPGKGERHGKLALAPRLIESALHGEPFALPAGGDQKNDFIYNKDAGRGLALAAVAERPQQIFYNIGSGVGLSLKDFAAVLREMFPAWQVRIGDGLDYLGGYEKYSVLDISAAGRDLNYRPLFDLRAALSDYVSHLNGS